MKRMEYGKSRLKQCSAIIYSLCLPADDTAPFRPVQLVMLFWHTVYGYLATPKIGFLWSAEECQAILFNLFPN